MLNSYRGPSSMVCGQFLQIANRIPPRIENIAFYIHPKSKKKVNDYRRTYSCKGEVNKIFTNGSSGNSHPFTNGSANSENMPLNKMFYFIHNINYEY